MRRIQPLPIRVRHAHGESLASYSNALATANHQTVWDIESALRARGLLVSHARSSPERKALWRNLGNLHPRSFTDPPVQHGSPVPERILCPGCARRHAFGRRHDIGLVCLTHRAWFGTRSPTTDEHVLDAERAFRKEVSPWAHMGSPVWLLAQECAITTVNPALLDTREGGTDFQRAYPEIVAYASLILAPDFLAILLDPDLPRTERAASLRGRVAPLVSGEDPWRAETRLMDLSRDLLTPGGIEKWCLTSACAAATGRASLRSSAPTAPRRRATGPTAAAS